MLEAWPELLGATAPERLALVMSGIMIVGLSLIVRALWRRLRERETELERLYSQQRDLVKGIADCLGNRS